MSSTILVHPDQKWLTKLLFANTAQERRYARKKIRRANRYKRIKKGKPILYICDFCGTAWDTASPCTCTTQGVQQTMNFEQVKVGALTYEDFLTFEDIVSKITVGTAASSMTNDAYIKMSQIGENIIKGLFPEIKEPMTLFKQMPAEVPMPPCGHVGYCSSLRCLY